RGRTRRFHSVHDLHPLLCLTLCIAASCVRPPPRSTRQRFFGFKRRLSLRPGETGGLPAARPASVAFGIEWPLETVRDIAAGLVPCRRHGLRSPLAAPARPADEIKLCQLIDPGHLQHVRE